LPGAHPGVMHAPIRLGRGPVPGWSGAFAPGALSC
jgi:hypothetical protein